MVRAARWSSFGLILVLAMALGFSIQRSDAATTRNVSMLDNVFSPSTVTGTVGDTVIWRNNGGNPHTSTGRTPLSLWNSGTLSPSQSFSRTFGAAGTFPYDCQFHASIGMKGTAVMRMTAQPTSGAVGTSFKLFGATASAVSPFVYDYQMKVPGGVFTNWRMGQTAKVVTFNSTGKVAGSYQFRSRLRNTSTGAASGWSPAKIVTVN